VPLPFCCSLCASVPSSLRASLSCRSLRTPNSALLLFHSALRTPHSALDVPRFPLPPAPRRRIVACIRGHVVRRAGGTMPFGLKGRHVTARGTAPGMRSPRPLPPLPFFTAPSGRKDRAAPIAANRTDGSPPAGESCKSNVYWDRNDNPSSADYTDGRPPRRVNSAGIGEKTTAQSNL